ncbi:hypothetical protein DNTS_000284 [Danionella cerebrum]|uniref:Sorting nexin C-terminal domain-containing protein n=1 Tax=Danionella cerebrum TaxID=2873325 RepID=A0A553R721_9TELE|nr:hypothetical protein DNTS_000284 [Danionella translucida]
MVNQSGPTSQPSILNTDEEPKEGAGEGPVACKEEMEYFRSKESDVYDYDQTSYEPDGFSDGQDSLAESLDTFVNRSKLVFPSAYSNGLSSSATSLNEGIQMDSADACKTVQFGGRANRKEKLTSKKSNGSQIFKVKEKAGFLKEESKIWPQAFKKESNSNLEQVEATKALFDLFKEITGNSFLYNIIDAILKTVQPLVKKKINSFLKRMHPTESQIASYIDHFREVMWPEENMPVQATYSNSLILKKTDVETVFKIFQDTEENKKLVYMLLSYILKEFLPGEAAFHVVFNQTVKDFVL